MWLGGTLQFAAVAQRPFGCAVVWVAVRSTGIGRPVVTAQLKPRRRLRCLPEKSGKWILDA